MYSLRRVATGALTATILSSLAVFIPTTAEATSPPEYHHPPIAVTDYRGETITGLDGSFTIGCAGADLVTYDKTGKLTRRIDHTEKLDRGIPNCIGSPVVDKDGILYGIPSGRIDAYNYGDGDLYAYDGSKVRWKYPVRCTLDIGSSIAIGGNGNIYVTTRSSTGSRLIGLAPKLEVGQTVPKKVLDIPIKDCADPIHAYKDGIVTHSQLRDGRYYSYGGKDLGPAPKGDVWGTRVGADGTLFFQDSNLAITRHIKTHNPRTGQIGWSYTLPPNTTTGTLTPTFNGGVIAHVWGPLMAQPGIPASPPETVGKLLVLNKNGFLVKEVVLLNQDASGNVYSDTRLVTDTRDNLVITRILSVKTTVDWPKTVPAIEVMVRSSATGAVLDQKLIIGDPQPNGQPSGVSFSGIPAITGDTLKLITHCSNCHGSYQLRSLKLKGLGVDYPRGVVLVANTKKQPAPVPYVAMGDSFSSGEGVRPFESGTDEPTNRCHRSERAYANLISRDPWLGASLAMGKFVACSGAETKHVTGKNENNREEDAQVNALNGQTKVVTLTIGGNDIRFGDFATACFWDSTTCREGSKAYKDSLGRVDKTLPGALKETYKAVLKRAPNAHIYVLGYPHIAPAKTRTSLPDPRCMYLHNSGVSGTHWADARGARKLVGKLNVGVGQALEDVKKEQKKAKDKQRLHFVEVNASNSPFSGHTVCASPGTSYFNNVDTFIGGGKFFLFHPNHMGHTAYKTLARKEMLK